MLSCCTALPLWCHIQAAIPWLAPQQKGAHQRAWLHASMAEELTGKGVQHTDDKTVTRLKAHSTPFCVRCHWVTRLRSPTALLFSFLTTSGQSAPSDVATSSPSAHPLILIRMTLEHHSIHILEKSLCKVPLCERFAQPQCRSLFTPHHLSAVSILYWCY